MRMNDLGKEIKIDRERAGMTQDELKEKADIGQSYLSQIENGSKIPKPLTLKAIVNALEEKLDENLKDKYADMLKDIKNQQISLLVTGATTTIHKRDFKRIKDITT